MNITGTYLKNTDGNHDKFYAVVDVTPIVGAADARTFLVGYGSNKSPGEWRRATSSEASKLIRQKTSTAKGYKRVTFVDTPAEDELGRQLMRLYIQYVDASSVVTITPDLRTGVIQIKGGNDQKPQTVAKTRDTSWAGDW